MNPGSSIPKFYERWLGDFGSPGDRGRTQAGDETDFDCRSCFMLKPKGLTRDLGPFLPGLKCCTFHPFLPSFTLGALITRHEITDETLNRYFSASRLTPLGAFPRKPGTSICETGKHVATGCVFLAGGGEATCTIRDFRPSTCSAYVCRSSRGVEGLREWREWEAKLAEFEWSLAHLAAFELGYTLDDVAVEFRSRTEAREFFARAFAVSLRLPWPP